MPTKKIDTVEEPAAQPAPVVAPVAVAERPRTSPLAISGVALASAAIAALLFGGGVVVGTLLPAGQTQSQFGPGQGGFPGGPGPGQGRPGQDDSQP